MSDVSLTVTTERARATLHCTAAASAPPGAGLLSVTASRAAARAGGERDRPDGALTAAAARVTRDRGTRTRDDARGARVTASRSSPWRRGLCAHVYIDRANDITRLTTMASTANATARAACVSVSPAGEVRPRAARWTALRDRRRARATVASTISQQLRTRRRRSRARGAPLNSRLRRASATPARESPPREHYSAPMPPSSDHWLVARVKTCWCLCLRIGPAGWGRRG